MRKFILQITDGIQEMVEAETLAEAKRKYEEITAEAGETTQHTPTILRQNSNNTQRKGLYDYLIELKGENFFASPRTLGEIKAKLQEKTLHYPTTTFPPYLNRLIRERILRRFKQSTDGKEAWVYVNY